MIIPHSRPSIEHEDILAVEKVLSSGMLAEGTLACTLAQRLNNLAGGAGGVVCGSGTQALVLALRAARICCGKRVALPTYVCPSVLAAIQYVGAEPVFCDIAEDLLLDQGQALHAARTCEALIVPYVLGRWRDFSGIYGQRAVIIEDFAQFIGPRDMGFPGLRGDLGIFSLHATKVLCAGEGGVTVASSPELLSQLHALKRICDSSYGFNLTPLSDLQAALGLAQLDRLADFTARRARVAAAYQNLIRDLPGLSWPWAARCLHFRFPILIPAGCNLEELMYCFEIQDVAVRRPVDTLSHRLRPGLRDEDFPVALSVWGRALSLPIHPGLSDGELTKVLDAAQNVMSRIN